MNHPRSVAPTHQSTQSQPVQVLRIEAGFTFELRTLSRSYGGLFVHWVKDKSRYCAGRECRSDWHKLDRQWRGYAAVEWYDKKSSLWIPTVWEITENCELDLRGQYDRGQVWRVGRAKGGKGKQEPVSAVLMGFLAADLVPPEWDYRVVLYHLYHITEVDLSHSNPMPSRLTLPPSVQAPGTKLLHYDSNLKKSAE
jgi:hypothetical protein